ncbi:formate dehydrogenase subunit gamma [Syntrophus aciditrophicus]|uniref:Formate dehydrogenase, cytochrome b subunit n=1 Tax=Syntrophus aciditrophicus (strain SB) TaxID=56780 RepID=Q2LVY5_SYNAS|nr:formate dehydrogenase subunit gamma [Syntrophus aciditrophicus]ABC78247.1 formate dehydrogenase, cytochrome b subunit [Syntrophus aciditrophicus SB]OPY18456.1 MAG: Formate dehydrogenase, cytochrome b556(fdo) subunit [Syntrophus sp. PtaB.Bin075]
MRKGLIQATDSFERIVHWCLAISCLILCITGLGMMFHSLNFIGTPFGGLKSLKYLHNFTALFFILSLYFTIRMWWKEAGIFVFPEDLDWIKSAGGYLWHVDKVPEVGKYNPGQKMFFLVVAGGGAAMVLSGLIMLFPLNIPAALVRLMYLIHAAGFVAIFAFFFIHLYLGTIGSPGSLPAMLNGWVTRAWLKKQHPKWLKEMEEEGKLVVFGEEKTNAGHGH